MNESWIANEHVSAQAISKQPSHKIPKLSSNLKTSETNLKLHVILITYILRYYVIGNVIPSLLSPQRHRDRPELKVSEAPPRAAAAQDGKPRARAQGCV